MLLKYFGNEQYGTLAYVLSIVTFSQILNISLNMTLTKYIAEFYALHDYVSMKYLINNSYVISLIANLFVSIILVGCSLSSPDFMHIQANMWPQFVSIIQALAVFTLINGLAQVPRGILLGLQHYSLSNITTIPSIIAPAICILIIQFIDLSLLSYIFILQISIFISGILTYICARKVLPAIRHGLSVNKQALSKILSFNIYHVLNQLSDILFYTTDKIILQQVSGAVAVANYSVIERPNQLVLSFTSLPLSAIVPACSKAYAENNTDLINMILVKGTRFYLFMTLPFLCTLTFLMQRFLAVWMGDTFIFLAFYAQLFMSTMIAAAPFRIFSHLLVGKGRISEIVNIKIIYAFINVALSYVLARKLGILGVIIPTLFFWYVVYPSAWLYLMKSESISIARFFIKVIMPTLAMILVCWASTEVLDIYFDHSLFSLLLLGGLCIGTTYSFLFFLIIERDEIATAKDMAKGLINRFKQI